MGVLGGPDAKGRRELRRLSAAHPGSDDPCACDKVPSNNIIYETVKGEPYSCLTNAATKLQADLIAIGTHSRVNLIPYKLGGTAKDILAAPPCDVLVAKGL